VTVRRLGVSLRVSENTDSGGAKFGLSFVAIVRARSRR
jgi:hypothetical protein